MKLAVNATVGGTTYASGTDTSKVPAEDRKILEANDALFETEGDGDDTSVGAGSYDDAKQWTKAVLAKTLEERNADLADDEQVQPEGDKREHLVAALELLDERHPVTA